MIDVDFAVRLLLEHGSGSLLNSSSVSLAESSNFSWALTSVLLEFACLIGRVARYLKLLHLKI